MNSNFTPDVFDEHFDDGRALDNEIDDSPRMRYGSPRMLSDPDYELDTLPISNELIGAEQDAILQTLQRVRDNRRPCPPMKAVDIDELPVLDQLGQAVEAAPGGPYPMALRLLEKHRAAGTPRIVRVDTEGDYQIFRTRSSPERTALLRRLAQLENQVAAHLADPNAHDRYAVQKDLGQTAMLSDMVEAVEADKQIPLRMPKRFDGLLEQWHQDGMAAATMILPHEDGGRRFITASEPVKKGELEAAKAAAEAGVSAAAIVGYLPAIGASLAGANAMKALASGAESLLRRPEAKGGSSFMVRLDPQVSPAIFALGELCCLCKMGNQQACAEWNQLAAAAPPPVKQAMVEILRTFEQQAPTSVGGAISDFFAGLWAKIRHVLNGAPAKTVTLPPAATPKALPERAA